LNQLNSVEATAQILAGVSNYHRLAGLGNHRYLQPPADQRNVSDPRRKVQAGQLKGREPQICRSRFSRVPHRLMMVIFSGHAGSVATRVPEKIPPEHKIHVAPKKISSSILFTVTCSRPVINCLRHFLRAKLTHNA
jgi:hypothetical protein